MGCIDREANWIDDGLEQRRRARREAARHRRTRIRRARFALLVLTVVAAIVIATVLSLGGGQGSAKLGVHPSALAGEAHPRATTATEAGAPHRASVRAPGAARAHQHLIVSSEGSLPQTQTFPSGTDSRFRSLMGSLWEGIVHNSTSDALLAFFPRVAYVQVKAIAEAGGDWSNRLVHDYQLDIGAAHALLGSEAAHAELVRVDVNSSYGHWVPPGACYNGVGYYEMPGARVVYREGGSLRSFGIASMISWRGVWYVVHLGAVLREGDSGVVDEPQSGAGEPAYSGTC